MDRGSRMHKDGWSTGRVQRGNNFLSNDSTFAASGDDYATFEADNMLHALRKIVSRLVCYTNNTLTFKPQYFLSLFFYLQIAFHRKCPYFYTITKVSFLNVRCV